MTDSKSSDEIEREIEAERADLKGTLDQIQDNFTPEAIVSSITNQFRNHGGDVGRNIADTVKENPMAVALTGIGLAWMIFGSGPSASAVTDRVTPTDRGRSGSRYDDDRYPEGSRHVAMAGDPGGLRRRDPYRRGPVPAWADPDLDEDFGDSSTDNAMSDRVAGAADSVRSSAKSAASGASSAASSAGDRIGMAGRAAGDAAGRAGSAVGDAGRATADAARSGLDSVRDGAARARYGASARAESAQRSAARMRRRAAEGTEQLSDAARTRVIQAREHAISAWERSEAAISRGGDQAADFYDEHPLVAGALALAVGAAIAGAIPRTRVEDAYMGEQSDAAFSEAERIFAEERAKAEKVAGAVVDEAKSMADETGRKVAEAKDRADAQAKPGNTAADEAGDTVKSAADRLGETAKSEADKQGLGKPKI